MFPTPQTPQLRTPQLARPTDTTFRKARAHLRSNSRWRAVLLCTLALFLWATLPAAAATPSDTEARQIIEDLYTLYGQYSEGSGERLELSLSNFQTVTIPEFERWVAIDFVSMPDGQVLSTELNYFSESPEGSRMVTSHEWKDASFSYEVSPGGFDPAKTSLAEALAMEAPSDSRWSQVAFATRYKVTIDLKDHQRTYDAAVFWVDNPFQSQVGYEMMLVDHVADGIHSVANLPAPPALDPTFLDQRMAEIENGGAWHPDSGGIESAAKSQTCTPDSFTRPIDWIHIDETDHYFGMHFINGRASIECRCDSRCVNTCIPTITSLSCDDTGWLTEWNPFHVKALASDVKSWAGSQPGAQACMAAVNCAVRGCLTPFCAFSAGAEINGIGGVEFSFTPNDPMWSYTHGLPQECQPCEQKFRVGFDVQGLGTIQPPPALEVTLQPLDGSSPGPDLVQTPTQDGRLLFNRKIADGTHFNIRVTSGGEYCQVASGGTGQVSGGDWVNTIIQCQDPCATGSQPGGGGSSEEPSGPGKSTKSDGCGGGGGSETKARISFLHWDNVGTFPPGSKASVTLTENGGGSSTMNTVIDAPTEQIFGEKIVEQYFTQNPIDGATYSVEVQESNEDHLRCQALTPTIEAGTGEKAEGLCISVPQDCEHKPEWCPIQGAGSGSHSCHYLVLNIHYIRWKCVKVGDDYDCTTTPFTTQIYLGAVCSAKAAGDQTTYLPPYLYLRNDEDLTYSGDMEIMGVARLDDGQIGDLVITVDGDETLVRNVQTNLYDEYTCTEISSANCNAMSRFKATLDTTQLSNGEHEISVHATRADDMTSSHYTVIIVVDNENRPADDSQLTDHTFPSAMACGESQNVSLTLENTGHATWVGGSAYKLAAVGNSDPFTSTTRIAIPSGTNVYPGQSHTFELELTAPLNEGNYRSDWRMVHEGVTWFGNRLDEVITVQCSEPAQDPYLGSPVTIRLSGSRIEAEHFDYGGEGVAYHDLTATNDGDASVREESVDISDRGTLYSVTHTLGGEWMEYTVDVENSGLYDIKLRAQGNNVDGARIRLYLEGQPLTDTTVIPNAPWQSVVIEDVYVPAGDDKILRLLVEAGGFWLDWIEFVAPGPEQAPYFGSPFAVGSGTTRIEAEHYDIGGEGLAWEDVTAGNDGGALRSDGIDITRRNTIYAVTHNRPGEWLEYTVDVASSGFYDLHIRAEGHNPDGAALSLKLNGATLTQGVVVSEGNFQTITVDDVYLSAGQGKILRIEIDTGGFWLDWIEFER